MAARGMIEDSERVGEWLKQKGGIYFPSPARHVPFDLERDAFEHEAPPTLPTAKSICELAASIEFQTGYHDEVAAKAQQWETAGGVTYEDWATVRRLIDKLLLCSAADRHDDELGEGTEPGEHVLAALPPVPALPLLVDLVDYALWQLHNLAAQANRPAAEQLAGLLAIHVGKLDELALSRPEGFKAIARLLPAFPVMHSKFKEQQIENDRLINELNVGAEFWNQQHRKLRKSPKGKGASAKEIAAKLIDYLDKYRFVYGELSAGDLPAWTKELRRLKPFSAKEAWPKWFDLAWKVVLETTGGQPSEVDAYRKIARHFRKKKKSGIVVDAAHSAIKEGLMDAFQEFATGKTSRSKRARGADGLI